MMHSSTSTKSQANLHNLFLGTRVMTMKHLILAILWFLLAGFVSGQEDNSTRDDLPKSGDDFVTRARGFLSHALYASDGFSTVNLFNGNLNQAIPLGSEYRVGPSLSYSLTLHYNSTAWDFEEGSCLYRGGIPPEIKKGYFQMSVPAWSDNAGIGWRLSLGRLFEPDQRPYNLLGTQWIYEAPDGARVSLYSQLLPGIPNSTLLYNDPDAPIDNILYSRDGTYLRVKSYAPEQCEDIASNSHGCITIEFPNGNRTDFHNLGNESSPDWRPVRMADPYGNFVTITYSTTRWTLHDSIGRTQEVDFADSSYSKVTQVRAAGIQGQTATFQFQYTAIPIARYRFHSDVQAGSQACLSGSVVDPYDNSTGNGVATITPEFLTRLVLPDNGFYEFDYYRDDGVSSSGNLNDQKSGALSQVRLPSGLYRDFKYSTWGYTQIWDSGLNLKTKSPTNFTHGIAQIEAYELNDQNQKIESQVTKYEALTPADSSYSHLTDQQRYAPSDFDLPSNKYPTKPFAFIARKVTDPLGHYNISYFQTARQGFQNWGGLPITFRNPQTGEWPGGTNYDPGEGPFLSEEFYNATGQLLRSTWLKYKVIQGSALPPFDKNAIKTEVLTKFHDPETGTVLAESKETYSDFDGLGNLRRTETSSTVPHTGPSKIEITDYDVSNATVSFSTNTYNSSWGIANLDNLVPPLAIEPWILGLYAKTEVNQGNKKSLEYVCFDRELLPGENGSILTPSPTYGLVLSKRVLKGQSFGDHDILTRYQYDPLAHGRHTLIAVYGGDAQRLESNEACMDPGILEPQYLERLTYQHGEVSQRQILNCDGGTELAQGSVFLDLGSSVIDQNTGFMLSNTDTSGVTTTLQFDILNRIQKVQVPSLGVRWFEYQFPTVTNPMLDLKLTEKTCTSASTSQPCSEAASLTIQKHYYDRFGRLGMHEKRLPLDLDSSGNPISDWVAQYHSYNKKNWHVSTSVWAPIDASGPIAETLFTDYDPFGRAGKTIAPDGSETTIQYENLTDWLSITQSHVQGDQGELETGLRHHQDGFGRVIAIEEKVSHDQWMISSYAYDQEDRLITVCVNDTDFDPQTCATQQRTFNYDGRGFLIQTTEPELGTMTYQFNHAGSMLSSTTGDPNRDTFYLYDRANRLVQLRDGHQRPLVENWYAKSNRPGEVNAGKLFLTKRHNYIPTDSTFDSVRDIVISQQFGYANQAGLLTKLTTQATTGAQFQWEATYDELSQIKNFQYPFAPTFSVENASPRTITRQYQDGYLTAVSEPTISNPYISKLTYHPNEMLAGQVHGNGVTDFFDLDPLGYRLGHISIESHAVLWSSGPFHYDPRGNIKSIGPDAFNYDRLSRMVHGQVTTQNGQLTQQASFDPFGNLTQFTEIGAGSTRTFGVNQANNRILAAAYDQVGNMTQTNLGGQTFDYTYDALNKMTSTSENGSLESAFLYDASGNRIAIWNLATGQQTWTLRGADDQLARTFSYFHGRWTWEKDYIHGSKGLVATVDANQTQHLHLDHLGSTRIITEETGLPVERFDYFPFGGYTESQQTHADETVQFTGHERDQVGSIPEAHLDYMFARYYAPHLGRFLSPDPQGGDVTSSQSWNRYTYAANNPIRFIDPDGESPISALAKFMAKKSLREGIKDFAKKRIQKRLEKHMSKKMAKEFQKDLGQALSEIDTMLQSHPAELVFELVPIAGDLYGGAKFAVQTKKAFDKLQDLENKYVGKIYDSLEGEAKKKFKRNMRRNGVRDAVKDQKAGVKNGDTYQKGKVDGHHTQKVEHHPDKMADPRNIEMMTKERHKEYHKKHGY